MRSITKSRLVARLAAAESNQPARAARRRANWARYTICNGISIGRIATEPDLIAEAAKIGTVTNVSDLVGIRVITLPIGLEVLIGHGGAIVLVSVNN